MKKIVHTADWHLGARLGATSRLPEQRRFLEWLSVLLERERPDLLVVAGDVFDSGTPSNEALGEFYGFLAKVSVEHLARHVVVVGGNHDSPSLLRAPQPVLAAHGIIVVPDAADAPDQNFGREAFSLDCSDGGSLAVAAIPFLRAAELSNFARAAGSPDAAPVNTRLASGFRAHVGDVAKEARNKAPSGSPLVIVAHATVSGARPSDDISERLRRAVGGLDEIPAEAFPPADYIALGHFHRHQCVGGNPAIRYAGAPVPMSFSEAVDPDSPTMDDSAKGVVVVTLDDERTVARFEPYRDAQVFWRLRGDAESVVQTLRRRLEANPSSTAWIEASLVPGGGDPVAFRQSLREAVEGTSVTLMLVRSEEVVHSSRNDLGNAAGRDLWDFTPLSLARHRLEKLGLSSDEVEEYSRLLIDALDPGADAFAPDSGADICPTASLATEEAAQ